MNKENWNSIRELIAISNHLNVTKKYLGKPDSNLISKISTAEFDESIRELHSTFNGFLLKWTFNNLEGCVNILQTKHLFDKTRVELGQMGIEWHLDSKPLSIEGSYIPIDMFTDESSVGVFNSFGDKGLLFYYDSGASFYSLNIDITSYLKLMVHTRGVLRWPRLLVGLQGVYFLDLIESFMSNIRSVNPEFQPNNFKDEYKSYLLNRI